MKYLNYQQIEVRIMTVQDALHQLKLEISENENRKDFSFSEKMKWAEELKKEYSKIAKENQGKRNDLREKHPCCLCGREVRLTEITGDIQWGYCDICDKASCFDLTYDKIC